MRILLLVVNLDELMLSDHLVLELFSNRLQIGSSGHGSCSLPETESLRADSLTAHFETFFLCELYVYGFGNLLECPLERDLPGDVHL